MRIKAKLLGVTQYHDDLNDKKVVLPVSVSQLYHEGKKFIATLELIKNRFCECDIIVSDTLQRYNFLNENSLENAINITYQLGTEWIQRNISHLEKFSFPFHIIRWSECLAFSGFKLALEKIKDRYENDISLQMAMTHDVNSFIERRNSKNNLELFVTNCKNYLFEEAAIVISYFVEKQYDYIVYPSAIPRFIAKCREIFVSIEAPDLLRDLKIYFKKTGDLVS